MKTRYINHKSIRFRKPFDHFFSIQNQALEAADNGISIFNRDGVLLWVNQAMERMSGYTREQLIGSRANLFKSGVHDTSFYKQLWDTVLAGEAWRGEIINRRQDGALSYEESVITPVRDSQGEISHFINIKQDISANKQRQREMESILAVASAVRTAESRSEIIATVIEEVEHLLEADGVSVSMVDPASGAITLEQAAEGMSAVKGIVLLPGEEIIRAILNDRRPYHTDDVPGSPAAGNRDYHPEKIPQLGIPLVAQDKAIGVMWICRRFSFGETDLRVLSAIADIAANAINRATLNEETALHLERLSSLREVDRAINSSLDLKTTLNVVIEQTITHLKVDAAAILMYYPNQHSLRYNNTAGFRYQHHDLSDLKLGEGKAGQAVLNHQPIFIQDVRRDDSLGNRYFFDQEGFISFGAYPLVAKDEIKGILEIFHRSVLNPDQGWMDYYEALAGQAAIAIHNAEMFFNISRTNMELIAAYEDTIEGWSRALEMRDRETVGHSRRVTQMTMRLARELQIPDEEINLIRQGVLLHDIGKMSIPDSILLKPGPLTEEEWSCMRRHPEYARDFLDSIPHLRPTAIIPYTHHERWNGSGYPQGLKGEEIPLASRAFMVVDVWDALSHERPYKQAWLQEEVLQYLADNAGVLFDPHVVSVFMDLYQRGEFGPTELLGVSAAPEAEPLFQ